MYHQKHYGNHEFAIDQGELKLKNELHSSWVKYTLDFLFYKSRGDPQSDFWVGPNGKNSAGKRNDRQPMDLIHEKFLSSCDIKYNVSSS